jgi:hypothetical protein
MMGRVIALVLAFFRALAINLMTAQAVGLTIPPSLLAERIG